MSESVKTRTLQLGLKVFVLVSAVGLSLSFILAGEMPSGVGLLDDLSWGWLVLGLALSLSDWYGGGLRLWFVIRLVEKPAPMTSLMVASGMGSWGAIVTPAHSGGSPMLGFALWRVGHSPATAMLAIVAAYVATIAFLALTGPIAVWFGAADVLGTRPALLGLTLYDLYLAGLSVVATILAGLAVLIAFPRPLSRLINRLRSGAAGSQSRPLKALNRLGAHLEEAIAHLARLHSFNGAATMVLATGATLLAWSNKVFGGYVALRILGIDAPFWEVMQIQLLLMFLVYFTPIPGGSGVAEVLSTLVMAPFVPAELLGWHTFLWRVIASYGIVVFGLVVLQRWLRTGLRDRSVLAVPEPDGGTDPG